jgi:hypothetical protein
VPREAFLAKREPSADPEAPGGRLCDDGMMQGCSGIGKASSQLAPVLAPPTMLI